MIDQHDHTIIKWAIGLLASLYTVSFGWVLGRLNRISNKTDDAYDKAHESRIILAERHYTKLEVDHLVRESIKPIQDKLEDIGDDVKFLVRERKGGND